MLTKNINFKNFKVKKSSNKIKKDLNIILKKKNSILNSLSSSYRNSYSKKTILKFKKYSHIKIIGIGGSIIGTKAIYQFLKNKIKKNFYFNDDLQPEIKIEKKNIKYLNLIVSKSGNTLETISNSNIIIKKKIKIFLLQRIERVIYIY